MTEDEIVAAIKAAWEGFDVKALEAQDWYTVRNRRQRVIDDMRETAMACKPKPGKPRQK